MRPVIKDNQLLWETYSMSTPSYDFEHDWKKYPAETTRVLDDLGLKIVFVMDMPEDRELDKENSGWYLMQGDKQLDWTYSDEDLTLDMIENHVRSSMKSRGVPSLP